MEASNQKEPKLIVEGLTGGYGSADILKGLSLIVGKRQVVSLLGANGAGKTTALKAISGLLPRASGRIEFEGVDLMSKRPHQRAGFGLAHVPEGRRVFPTLSVRDNLLMGAWTVNGEGRAQFERVMELFPRLKERLGQAAGTLSGGEQQMLAIGRALRGAPDLLVLDEPSMGLSPKLVEDVFEALGVLRAEGMSMLIVEQFAERALSMSDYGYLIQRGELVKQGTAASLLADKDLLGAYH